MKIYLASIIILLLTHLHVNSSSKKIERHRRLPITHKRKFLRVLDGEPDINNEYPFVVSLGGSIDDPDYYTHDCTGSLIADQWVLTAAHCIKTGKGPIKIRFGNMTLLPDDMSASYSQIRKIIQHPNYVSYGDTYILLNDIALLLVQKVRIEFYGRVSGVDYKTLIGLPVKYVGLGHTASDTDTDSYSEEYYHRYDTKHRQIGEGVIVPCEENYLSSPVICIKPKCSRVYQVEYYGDSGGPLLQGGLIVGVLSAYWTPVSPYLDWISVVMSSHG